MAGSNSATGRTNAASPSTAPAAMPRNHHRLLSSRPDVQMSRARIVRNRNGSSLARMVLYMTRVGQKARVMAVTVATRGPKKRQAIRAEVMMIPAESTMFKPTIARLSGPNSRYISAWKNVVPGGQKAKGSSAVQPKTPCWDIVKANASYAWLSESGITGIIHAHTTRTKIARATMYARARTSSSPARLGIPRAPDEIEYSGSGFIWQVSRFGSVQWLGRVTIRA